MSNDDILPSCDDQKIPYTPFTKASPNCPHTNNVDNSIKIAFTNSEHRKIIHTFFTSAHLKKKKKMDKPEGKKGDLWPHLGNNPDYFGIVFTNSEVCSWCGYYADDCSIEKVRIILVPFRVYDQIMRILSALCEFVNGVLHVEWSNGAWFFFSIEKKKCIQFKNTE